jgi:hypothetical protein
MWGRADVGIAFRVGERRSFGINDANIQVNSGFCNPHVTLPRKTERRNTVTH